jgi:hypothetical protein
MVNIISGINFLTNFLSIDIQDVAAAFSFRSNPTINTNIIYPDPWALNSSSGILNTNGGGEFFNYPGTGYFNGNNYFQLNKNYSLNDSTIFISYEKLRNENEVLISSFTGDRFGNFSGFYLGVNNANKLYFKYWNEVEGFFTFTYPKILSNKNLIVLNKTNSIITLGHYDINTFKFESQEFEIFQNNFLNNTVLNIGGTPNKIDWGVDNLKNFSGYMDRFYIFNNTPYVYSDILAKGLFAEPTGFEGEFNTYCYETGFLSGSGYNYTGIIETFPSGFVSGVSAITGYQNILSGYSYTGFTGYQTNIIGSYIDNCGNSVNIFEKIPLSGLINDQIPISIALTGLIFTTGFVNVTITGFISGIENIFINETICDSFFLVTGGIVYKYDDDYLSSLSYNEISLLYTIKHDNDIIEIFTEPYQNKTLEYNKDLIYDNLNSNYFYLDREFLPNELLLFGNGQALIDDGYKLIPSGYEIIRSPNLDYFITGITVETNKFFAQKDQLFYDYFPGRFWGFKNTGSFVTIPNNINNNYWVFKNGQKLIKNKDYNQLNSTLINLIGIDSDQENYIIFKEIPNYFTYSSGNLGSVNLTGKFNHGCSQVYYNGIKQKINNNYIENSDYDLLSGNFNESKNFQFLIYNNSNEFFV